MDAAYEMDLAHIRARTRAAIQAKAARGDRFTRYAPTGFTWAGDRLQVNAEEQRVFAAIRAAMDCGCGMSLRCIANRLAEQGIVSRAGKPFTAAAISRLQKRVA
jgi:DNA invertase Pin-like site-specific DNA recombinase